MEKQTIQLRISKAAYEVLVRESPGERQRGEWLSELLEGYTGQDTGQGVLERIEARLEGIEAQLRDLTGEK